MKKSNINWFRVIASSFYSIGITLLIIGLFTTIENFVFGAILLLIGIVLILKS